MTYITGDVSVEQLRSFVDVVPFKTMFDYLCNDDAIEMIVCLDESLDIAESAKRIMNDDTEWFNQVYEQDKIAIYNGVGPCPLWMMQPVECIRIEPIYLIKPV